MFSHCYQSGNPIELYNGHDKSLYSKWKFTGRNSKVYDPILKNYMHLLDIGTLSKITGKNIIKEKEDRIMETILKDKVPKSIDKMF